MECRLPQPAEASVATFPPHARPAKTVSFASQRKAMGFCEDEQKEEACPKKTETLQSHSPFYSLRGRSSWH